MAYYQASLQFKGKGVFLITDVTKDHDFVFAKMDLDMK